MAVIEPGKVEGIALNVSRARLTMLGFALAVNVFAIGNILQLSGTAVSQQVILDLNILVALLSSVAIGTVSAVLFLISERFDPLGQSDVGIFAFAELTMYVALSQTLNGLSQEFLNLFALNLNQFAAHTEELRSSAALLENLAFCVATIAWSFVAYIAPVWSMMRIPCEQGRRLKYLGFYAVVLTFVFYFNATAVQIAGLSAGADMSPAAMFLKQFWAPLLWSDLAVLHGA